MTNVQQPEMRRSGKDRLTQESAAATPDAQGNTSGGGPEHHGKVPPDQQSPYGPGDGSPSKEQG